ncbi:MAG TPA: hypothetical protein VFA84_01815 [Acidimicrobiales bacterium]|nr:hypothetical protein [Acidimicrobiales bacterium]
MSDARLEQFKADIADMRIRDPAVGRESLLLWAGVAGLVAGIALTVISFFLSKNTNSALDQADYHVFALIGVAVTVAGAALFVRYSVAAFLRFWLARLIYEQRVQTDRIVAAREQGVTSTL